MTDAIEEAATRHGCKWVIIDPWNEIEHLWGVSETETAYTVKALKHLKTLARKFKITLFLVTHPTKAASQNKGVAEMTLSDIAGSYAWRAKADIGVIVHRADDTSAARRISRSTSPRTIRATGGRASCAWSSCRRRRHIVSLGMACEWRSTNPGMKGPLQ